MAVSISKRDWVLDADGVTREKIEYMIDTEAEKTLLADPSRISASSVAIIKTTKQPIFIINGEWTV